MLSIVEPSGTDDSLASNGTRCAPERPCSLFRIGRLAILPTPTGPCRERAPAEDCVHVGGRLLLLATSSGNPCTQSSARFQHDAVVDRWPVAARAWSSLPSSCRSS